MKIKTNTIRKAITGGLLGLVAAASAGCQMSEFNPLFKPSRISSIRKERGLFEFGRKIEAMANSGMPYQIDDATDTLYVDMAHYHEALNEFGLTERPTFNELFETNTVKIDYTDPKTEEQVSFSQIIPNDGTLDTPFGRVDGFGRIQDVDERITDAARDFYGDPDMQIMVTQQHNHEQNPSVFLGFATLTHPKGATVITRASYSNLQQAAVLGGMPDAKYLIKIDRNSNLDHVNGDRSNPNFVSRVVAYGHAGMVASLGYEEIKVNDECVLVGVYNRPMDNAQAFVDEITQSLDHVFNATDRAIGVHSNFDLLSNRNSYLPSRQNQTSRTGNLAGKANEYNNAIDSSLGLINRLQGNAP